MKNTLYIAVLFILGLSIQSAQAQYAYFPTEGSITFEKTIHVKNLMKRYMNSLKPGDMSRTYIEQMITKSPETAVLEKKLSFRGDEVYFEPVEKQQPPLVAQMLSMLDNNNKVYQNLKKNESMIALEMGGSGIAIKDSLTDVKWKITNEYRNIAGYDCRRANGITLDSVYVVAFYTDQIPTSGGPGTIHGLPGMILCYVVPEQHINIYAKKVELTAPTIKSDIFKKKDEPMSREKTKARMKEIMGQWMTEQQLNLMLAAMFL